MMLSLKTRAAAGCVSRRSSALPRAPIAARRCLVQSTPKEVDVLLEKALKEAKDCEVSSKGANCAPAWDAVEELAAAKSHLKDAAKADPSLNDPLEAFCKDAPDADECRVYED